MSQSLKPLKRHMKRFRERRFLEAQMIKRFGENTEEYYLISKAIGYISLAHKGEKRRKNKDSRLAHEREMAGIADYFDIPEWEVYVAIFLHDLVEDYRKKGWTFKRIDEEFGTRVGRLARALHKSVRKKGESRKIASERTFRRVARGGRLAVIVKYIDRLHNLLNPWPGGERRIKFKMRQTTMHLIPLADRYRIPTHWLLVAVTKLQEKYGLDRPMPG